MTEADIQDNAKQAALWWFENEILLDEIALTRRAKAWAHDEMFGDGGLTHEFFDVPASWQRIMVETFIAEYRRLQTERPKVRKVYDLILFDCDGTLTTTKSGETFRKTADDWQWLPGRRERLRALYDSGVKMAIVSNQGGVAFGYMQEEDIGREIAQMAAQADIPFVYICYDHPTAKIEYYKVANSSMRKPAPGMLLAAMKAASVDAEHTLMVGDRPEDQEAAKAAGVDFRWAELFFGDAITP